MEHAVDPEYAARERAGERSFPARLRPGAHDRLADLLIHRQHPLTFCDVLRILFQEAAVVATGIILVAIVTAAVVITIAVI